MTRLPLLPSSEPQASRSRVCAKELRRIRKDRSPAIFALAVVVLTGVMGQRFYNQPKLDVGTIAPQTIKAPSDATVEDTKSTEANRKAARRGSTSVLMLDLVSNQQIYQDLQQKIALDNELRQLVGPLPFVETSILSTSTQLYLRGCPESEWQAILTAAAQGSGGARIYKNAVVELQAYRSKTSPQKLSALITTVSKIRQQYARALKKISDTEILKAEILNQPSLLELSDAEWRLAQIGINESAKRILTQGIAPGLPANIFAAGSKPTGKNAGT